MPLRSVGQQAAMANILLEQEKAAQIDLRQAFFQENI